MLVQKRVNDVRSDPEVPAHSPRHRPGFLSTGFILCVHTPAASGVRFLFPLTYNVDMIEEDRERGRRCGSFFSSFV